MLEMRGSDGLNVVINGRKWYTFRFFDVFGLQSKSAGDVGGASYLIGDELTAVTSFKVASYSFLTARDLVTRKWLMARALKKSRDRRADLPRRK